MKIKANYRKINAILPKSWKKKGKSIFNGIFFHYLAQFLFLVLLAQVMLFLVVAFFLQSEYRLKSDEYNSRQAEQVYWTRVAEQYPNAPDVLYNAAVSAINVGNSKEALVYIDRALKLDPLFMEARLLRKSLSN